jgi:glycosyltransferase involved in cell wall biosynthesis
MAARSSPDIAVVVPTYNRGRVLVTAIRSILAQTLSSFEVVIVDDGSRDDTAATVKSLADPRIRYWAQDNRGEAAARNRGVELSTSDVVVFLDSDDQALPEWLSTLVEAFASRRADIAFCGARHVRDAGARPQVSVQMPRPLGPAFANINGLFLAGTYAMRRKLFEELGGFDPECYFGEHTDFALRVAALSEQRALKVDTAMAACVQINHHKSGHLSQDPQKRLEGTERLIAKHAERLSRDRREFANYWSVAGVCAHKLQRRELASSCFLESLKLDPARPKPWLRYLMSMTGLVPSRVWSRECPRNI